jgi:hypothetical protein
MKLDLWPYESVGAPPELSVTAGVRFFDDETLPSIVMRAAEAYRVSDDQLLHWLGFGPERHRVGARDIPEVSAPLILGFAPNAGMNDGAATPHIYPGSGRDNGRLCALFTRCLFGTFWIVRIATRGLTGSIVFEIERDGRHWRGWAFVGSGTICAKWSGVMWRRSGRPCMRGSLRCRTLCVTHRSVAQRAICAFLQI